MKYFITVFHSLLRPRHERPRRRLVAHVALLDLHLVGLGLPRVAEQILSDVIAASADERAASEELGREEAGGLWIYSIDRLVDRTVQGNNYILRLLRNGLELKRDGIKISFCSHAA